MLQNLFFKGNFVLTIIFALSFYFTNQLLEVHKIKNFILTTTSEIAAVTDCYFYEKNLDNKPM